VTKVAKWVANGPFFICSESIILAVNFSKLLMMIRISFVCICFLGSLSVAFGQDTNKKDYKVVYDPIFWKEKLNLKNSQCREIESINTTFYRSVSEAARRSEAKVQYPRLIEERSERIWNVFSSNQKRKWKKLNPLGKES
jgi:hypothetical protein